MFVCLDKTNYLCIVIKKQSIKLLNYKDYEYNIKK